VIDVLRANPARIYGLSAAVVALVAYFLPSTPVGLVLAVVAATVALWSGQVVQRVEDDKTIAALYEDPPIEENL